MPANLLILPLLGGFWFVHHSHWYRFRSQHLDGYRLLLESAIAGTILLAIARCVILLFRMTPIGEMIQWDTFVAPGVPFLGTGVTALGIGMAVPFIDNRVPRKQWVRNVSVLFRRKILRRRGRTKVGVLAGYYVLNSEAARDQEIRTDADGLRRLIHDADVDGRLISVTLANGKWYVGFVAEALNLDPQERYFRILPILSGHRDKDTLQVRRRTNYLPVYERPGAQPRDFHITIRLEDVRMANLFDVNTYQEHFAADDDQPPTNTIG